MNNDWSFDSSLFFLKLFKILGRLLGLLIQLSGFGSLHLLLKSLSPGLLILAFLILKSRFLFRGEAVKLIFPNKKLCVRRDFIGIISDMYFPVLAPVLIVFGAGRMYASQAQSDTQNANKPSQNKEVASPNLSMERI